jgi:Protein of unknown function (DUF1091)
MTGNPQYCSNIHAVAFNDSLGVSRINMSFSLDKELLGMKAFATVKLKKPEEFSYKRELLKTTVDICRLKDGVIGNFLSKIAIDTFKKYTNYHFDCPVVKKVYYARNLQVLGNYAPRSFYELLLQGENFVEVNVVFKAKVAKVKGLVNGIVLTIQSFQNLE